jgi:hypothetical protein
MTVWLDPLDPANRSAVVSGAYGKAPHSEHGNPVPTGDAVDPIAEALAQASDVLDRLTGFFFHPAVQVEEDFTPTPRVTRLYPSFTPVRSVLSVTRMTTGASQEAPLPAFTLFGDALYFAPTGTNYGYYDGWLWGWCGCRAERLEQLRVLYNAGSTITASARRAVISLAHEYWLAMARCEECDTCALPDRTTSVVREGLSYTVADAEDPLNPGHTGLLGVDAWVRMVNPHKATRPSGVWTPDQPPPVVHSVRTARPIFPVVTP